MGGTEMKSQPCLGLSGFPPPWLRLGSRERQRPNVGGKPQKPPPPPYREGKQLRFSSGAGWYRLLKSNLALGLKGKVLVLEGLHQGLL